MGEWRLFVSVEVLKNWFGPNYRSYAVVVDPIEWLLFNPTGPSIGFSPGTLLSDSSVVTNDNLELGRGSRRVFQTGNAKKERGWNPVPSYNATGSTSANPIGAPLLDADDQV